MLTTQVCRKFTRYMHAHHVPHTKHMESCQLDEMMKYGQDYIEDFEDVSGVTHPSPNPKLHGVVQCVSPMKKSMHARSLHVYFDGEISDASQPCDYLVK